MREAQRVLVVDDEPSMREFLELLLAREGFEVDARPTAEAAIERLDEGAVDLVLTDLNLPGMSGLDMLAEVRRRAGRAGREIPVILITAYGTTESAVEAMKAGAFDYVLKPFNNDELVLTIRRALGHVALREENLQLREALGRRRAHDLIGDAPAMRSVYRMIEQVRDVRVSCLIHGESGTGKEMVARAIHHTGSRREGPFVAVNCGAIPENLIESELFGYRRGAFTGATRDKKGLFEAAHGGTLFLDEIADLPPHAQVKVLRALAERKVVPVGAVEPVEVDVRIVAASNRDLEDEVRAGRFREDLFYRLNVVRIDLPPLRERREDIALLAQAFLERFAREQGREIRGLDPAALAALEAYDWPGNVRELSNAIERAVALAHGSLVTAASLPPRVREGGGRPVGSTATPRLPDHLPPGGIDLRREMATVERRFLELALEAARGDRGHAARLLGINARQLRYRLQKHGLAAEDGDDNCRP